MGVRRVGRERGVGERESQRVGEEGGFLVLFLTFIKGSLCLKQK